MLSPTPLGGGGGSQVQGRQRYLMGPKMMDHQEIVGAF